MNDLLPSCLTLSLLFIGIVLSSPVAQVNNDQKDGSVELGPTRNEETSFFHDLNPEEKLWLMTASLDLYLREGDKNNSTVRPAPLPVSDLTVPNSLGSRVLNGEIPASFQAKFSDWVLREFELNSDDIVKLMEGREVCGPKQCADLPGLGQGCCPFG